MAGNGLSPAPRARQTNLWAIAALVCGIVQFFGAAPAGIAAIILGHKACRQIRQTGQNGYRMAKVGLGLGYFGLGLTLLVLVVLLAASHAVPARP
jgi:hypothetical protein